MSRTRRFTEFMSIAPVADPDRPIGALPRPGQWVRVVGNGEIVEARVVATSAGTVRVVAAIMPAPLEPRPDGRARLIWRGELHAMCVDGDIATNGPEWTIQCDPASVSTMEERARRRVAVRAPVQVAVPTRLSPHVGATWSINVSEGGVALEPVRGFVVAEREPLVVHLDFDDAPVLTVGRVVAAAPSEPVRVAFERISPTGRDQLIGVLNRLEAQSKVHAR